MPEDSNPEQHRIHKVVREAVVEISCQRPQLSINQLQDLLRGWKGIGINAENYYIWMRLDVHQVVENMIAEGCVVGRFEIARFMRSEKILFDVDANRRLRAEVQSKNTQDIKRTVLDLGTRFTRLQVAEIAESCQIKDETLIIATVQDMIAKHQVDAQYFASTKAVAFNQQANLAARNAFIAELEAEFANWGKDKQQGPKKS